MVHDVDGGVDDDHAAEGDAGYLDEAREGVEGVVEDGVALEAVCGWAHELHEVVCCVERGDLDQEFEELCREGRWWAWITREWLGRPGPPETTMVEEEVRRVKEDVFEGQWALLERFSLFRGLVSPNGLLNDERPFESFEGDGPHSQLKRLIQHTNATG